MQCISCRTKLASTFKHAFAQNVCPACGKSIMDEESLALIESIRDTLTSNATIREETAHNLAMVIIANYDIKANTNRKPMAKSQPPKAASSRPKEEAKAADPNLITADNIPDEISEVERDAIMADVVSKRYGMSDGLTDGDPNDDAELSEGLQGVAFSDNDVPLSLEQEREMRLRKQQSALRSGSGAFRRSG